jgi:leader peptidase (prepilin peptidase)/N-methyltransferase
LIAHAMIAPTMITAVYAALLVPPGLGLDGLPRYAWVAWWTITGLLVGSFLNVAIHRLPLEGETVSKPRRSRCPSCKTTLTWRENIPLLSWLAQRGRCRTCGWTIPWRYPLVELLTAALWCLVAARTLPERFDICIVQTIVLCGLVVATFVDFACFEIPDEVSIGGIVLAPIASLLVPDLHAGSPVAQWLDGPGAVEVSRAGALLASVVGMIVGGGSLWLIGKVGSALYGRDAMGFGDVKLLAAGGGFVGPGAALLALMIASVLASIAGVTNMLRFLWILRARASRRGRKGRFGRSAQVARAAGRYLPFGPYLAAGIGIVLLAWKDVNAFVPWPGVWHP